MMYAEPNWGMGNIKRHKDCPFRTKLGNCDAVGGFCTSVNETICEGIHKALNRDVREKGKWIKATGMMPPEFHGHHYCSECGNFANMKPPFGNREDLSKYCPNCGVDMRKKESEEWNER